MANEFVLNFIENNYRHHNYSADYDNTMGGMYTFICPVCQKCFKSDGIRMACSKDCHKKRAKMMKNNYDANRTHTTTCVVCKTPFPKSAARKTCSPLCSHKNIERRRKEYLKPKKRKNS